MSVVFRAEDEPVTSRVDYWRHVGGQVFVPLNLRILDGPDFRSRIVAGEVGAVRVTEVIRPRPGPPVLPTRRQGHRPGLATVRRRGPGAARDPGPPHPAHPGDQPLHRPLHRAAQHDAKVAVAFARVAALLDPPSAIMTPAILAHVLIGPYRRTR